MHRAYPEIDELLRQVADRFGKEVSATTDFERLSEAVEKALREQVSVSTLKRLWGYVNDRHKPRVSTLDILCRYVGFRSFADFQASLSSDRSSSFLSERAVRSADLPKRATVEVGWLPNRYLLLENLGGNRYAVREALHSKLQPGDTFTCHEFILGHPLYLSEVRRGELAAPLFIAGNKGGLTTLHVICE